MAPDPSNLPKLAFWVFTGFGVVAVVGGIVLALDDPGGLALVAFGVIFIGAGWAAKRIFSPPEGKKAVTIQEDAFSATRLDGRASTVSRSAVIHVDEDASEEEIEAAKAAWSEERFAARPDWASGRILAEAERSGGLHALAAGLWSFFAALAIGAGFLWGGMAWFVAAGTTGIAIVLSYLLAMARIRRKKFGRSVLCLDPCPARLGAGFAARLETEIAAGMAPDDGFLFKLKVDRRWEESNSSASARPTETTYRAETLFETETRAAPFSRPGGGPAAEAKFDLPEDLPPTTLSGANEGIFWRVTVEARMQGVDYQTEFIIPVLAAGTPI